MRFEEVVEHMIHHAYGFTTRHGYVYQRNQRMRFLTKDNKPIVMYVRVGRFEDVILGIKYFLSEGFTYLHDTTSLLTHLGFVETRRSMSWWHYSKGSRGVPVIVPPFDGECLV